MSAAAISTAALRAALTYDPKTGVFRWNSGRNAGRIAGGLNQNGYWRIWIGGRAGRFYLAHRLAWLVMHGHLPQLSIDHIDGDRSNNAIANLREASIVENNRNKKKQQNTRSCFKGVVPRKNCWQAHIRFGGRIHYLGSFADEASAHAAYCAAAAKQHGAFARFA